MKNYLPRSWINPKLAPGPSRIHGEGVFATAPIRCGEKLMEFGGLPLSSEDIATELYRERSVWKVGDDLFLALPHSDTTPSLDENLNHSCDANGWLDDEVTLCARRDIRTGEEITLDHGTWDFEEDGYLWDRDRCSCGAAQCRKLLGKDDWQLAAVQERYKGHFHPFVQQLIDAMQITQISLRKDNR
ncbi:MAG TPA: SET domain-containing protein [Rhizomicrobium sp.]|nr:SET domain-containing protein [Rhizomicrobium sp.]